MALCNHWPVSGGRCCAKAERYLMHPDGTPNPAGYVCRAHGEAIVAEYREKLGEPWYLVGVDEYGSPLHEPHQVETPEGWNVIHRQRVVLEGASYVVASHVVHELQSGSCGVGECRETAEAIQQAT